MAIHFGNMIEVFDKMVKQRLRSRQVQGWMASSDVLHILLTISEDSNNVLDITNIDHLLLVSNLYPLFLPFFFFFPFFLSLKKNK